MPIQDIAAQFALFAQEWAVKRLQRYFNLHAELPSEHEIIGVRDYLLSLTPEDRIYQKLNKVSWSNMVQLQKNWHDALAAKAAKMTEFGGNSEAETFLDCENGYRWAKLESSEQFDFEGNAMGHCIGKGNYDKSNNHFYSLRDSKNLPHATVEFDHIKKRYMQIQGRANEPVIADYLEDIVKLFNVLGIWNGHEKFLHNRDYVCSDSKIYFKPEDIKRIINSDSAFVTAARMKNASFGITTEGRFLYLTEEPPKGTSFRTVQLTKDSNIRDWKWHVAEDFDASHALLESVSARVKFGGNVNIRGTNVRHWHSDVLGDFYAYGSLLESVSSNVKFARSVDIEKTRIKHWHNDVPGAFYAYHSSLETIAAHVLFGKNVNISETEVKHFYNNVSGTFNASHSLLETIAPNVKFGGSVYVAGTRIKHWQNDVLGDFYATRSLLETIAAHVKFGGNIDIQGTKAEASGVLEIYHKNNMMRLVHQ